VVKDEEDEALPPLSYIVERLKDGLDIEQALLDGVVDAVIFPETLPGLSTGGVRRLIADAFATERTYYATHRIYPIMHVIVIKDAVLAQHPWVARNVLEAFEQAKRLAYRRLANPRRLPLVWAQELWEEQQRLFGGDPYPYSVEANRHTLETFLRYAREQGLVKEPSRVEDLFPEMVLDHMPRYWEGYEH